MTDGRITQRFIELAEAHRTWHRPQLNRKQLLAGYADAAVPMVGVIPVDKVRGPAPRLIQIGEAADGKPPPTPSSPPVSRE